MHDPDSLQEQGEGGGGGGGGGVNVLITTIEYNMVITILELYSNVSWFSVPNVRVSCLSPPSLINKVTLYPI